MAGRDRSAGWHPKEGTVDPAFWSGRRVFLTGHTGFKGSWLSLWLRTLHADVTGYALGPPTEPSLYTLAGVEADVRPVIADIRDFPRLSAALSACRPEVVIHMAAQSVVRRGYADPIETYSANVMGTVHLLEAIRCWGGGCAVVNVTSDKCYAHRASGPGYREEEPMGGDDPYSSSKGCAELVTTAFRRSYFPPDAFNHHGVSIASARAGNAVGGGDWTEDQLVPDLMRAFTTGHACRIRNPDAVRPWQFVLEPLRGYLILAQALARVGPAYASGWNFGPASEDARPVSWIAERLRNGWGGAAAWQIDGDTHPVEAKALRLDAAKAATSLGWRPALGLSEALDWTVQWYRGWVSGEDVRALTLAQIRQYEQLSTSRPSGANS